MLKDLKRLKISIKTGNEPFHSNGSPLNYHLQEFWRWSVSDLVSNATRGILAEFIVAKALRISINSVRDEWAAYDLTSPDGIKIEVKSAAYIQSWYQRGFSSIRFSTRKTKYWNADTNILDKESKNQAAIYIFALLAHRDKSTIDPLNVSQWLFYVVPTKVLNSQKGSQQSVSLKALEKLRIVPVTYQNLHDAVVHSAR